MARPLRIEYPGAIYHITNRGNARQPIFKDDKDREVFLEVLEVVVARYNWLCHAYCLMDNHYHLLIETPEGNLSQGMRQLNGIYTQRFNRKHTMVGHLFQGRFKAILVDKENYLLELCRYVVLNPVRAGIVKSPGKYKWSSYGATAGEAGSPPFLTTDWILSQFGRRRRQAEKGYKSFVKDGVEKSSPWESLRGQILLGDDKFVSGLEPYLKRIEKVTEVPRVQRFVERPSLEELFKDVVGKSKERRDRLIRNAHLRYGYTLAEIGRALGLHYSTISKVVQGE
jgi:REP element-mobilizing transposase RayT